MLRKKIMIVFGTRPEAIKMAPLIRMIKNYSNSYQLIVCVTGQHREMLDQVLDIFCIKPDIDLGIMTPNQSLSEITSSILTNIDSILKKENPNLVLVHGDTTTTLATSLACFYNKIKVGHVEAGLRTSNIHSPFPEELNRQVASKICDFHFAPTPKSKENLVNEGIDESKIKVTGNTVIDSLFWILDRIKGSKKKQNGFNNELKNILHFPWKEKKFILVTGHRRENFGEGFSQICSAIADLAYKYPDIHIIYPVHLNPNVSKPVRSILANVKNIHLIQPLDYELFIWLMSYSYFILTDSGGIQEEAPSLGKPVLVMRNNTERPEAVSSGTVKLVGPNKSKIIKYSSLLIEDEKFYQKMSLAHNPYGDGNACIQILDFLEDS